MTTNLSPNYAHWAAGAAGLLAVLFYAMAWSFAAVALLALGNAFEMAAWALLYHRGRDDA